MEERSQGLASQETHPVADSTESREKKPTRGLQIPRYFTTPGRHPFDTVEWERRTATLTNDKGDVIFEQESVEVPASWSQMATNVVSSKYLYGGTDAPDRETSFRQLLSRVSSTVARWGNELGYFASTDDATTFEMELLHILAHQKATF